MELQLKICKNDFYSESEKNRSRVESKRSENESEKRIKIGSDPGDPDRLKVQYFYGKHMTVCRIRSRVHMCGGMSPNVCSKSIKKRQLHAREALPFHYAFAALIRSAHLTTMTVTKKFEELGNGTHKIAPLGSRPEHTHGTHRQ